MIAHSETVDIGRQPGVGNNTHWTLDRRVPVAIIVGIAAQTFALVIVMAVAWTTMTNRIENLETFAEETKRTANADSILERDRGDRLIRLETHMENIFKELQSLNRKLDAPARPQ